MPEITYREANRRYWRSYWAMIALYCVACLGGAALIKSMSAPPVWFAAIVAAVTTAPFAAVFWLTGRLLRETDEYTRKVQTDALLTGGMITLSLAVLWSFFELYRVVPTSPNLPAMMFVAPAFLVFYGLSSIRNRIRDETGCGKAGQ